MASQGADTSAMRQDIQCLRALAVLLVVLYHAKIPGFSGGYLGVDVFFVISGFLVTKHIATEMSRGTFSFARFYWRRARRLLPAAYAVIGLTLAVHPWFLTPSIARDFYGQVIAAVFMAGNVGAWLQAGYFAPWSQFKPLLHFWSLGIEEQFYLLLPLGLAVFGRWRAAAVFGATLASLALCFWLMRERHGAAFYLLPSRAWELGVGASLALLPLQPLALRLRTGALHVGLVLASLLLLLGLANMPLSATHPGTDAILVCVATAVLILAQPKVPDFWALGAAASRLGDVSYSLYLVHWPLFALAANANVSGTALPWVLNASLVLVALGLAFALYYGVERPFRAKPTTAFTVKRDTLALTSIGLALVACVLAFRAFSTDSLDLAHRLRGNAGLNVVCDRETDVFKATLECQSDAQPEALLWGDSFAMQWVDALAQSGLSVMQATRSTCSPVLGLAAFKGSHHNEEWGRGCISFNRSVAGMLSTNGPPIVVFIGMWGYLTAGRVTMSSQSHPDQFEVGNGSEERLVEEIVAAVSEVRRHGKRVVFIAPAPATRFNTAACNERRLSRKFAFGARDEECNFQRPGPAESTTLSLLNRAAEIAKFAVIDPTEAVCGNAEICRSVENGAILYRDSGHLSYEGSLLVARRLNLAQRIRLEAR